MTQIVKLMGRSIEFGEFDDGDWSAFAGAEEGTLIHHCDDGDTTLLWYAPTQTLSEITCADSGEMTQRDWTAEQVL